MTFKFIDSIPICLYKNKRIFTYKVSELVNKGKSNIGWFYGFKLHLVLDLQSKFLKL
jgi:Transposase DDE domain